MNSEKVINMVLEDSLPSELTQYDFTLPTMSEYDAEDNSTGFDPLAKGLLNYFKKLINIVCVLNVKLFVYIL